MRLIYTQWHQIKFNYYVPLKRFFSKRKKNLQENLLENIVKCTEN